MVPSGGEKIGKLKQGRRQFGPSVVKPTAGFTGSLGLPAVPSHPLHRGNPVAVGEYTVFAGGTRDLRSGDLTGYDLVIPLTGGGIPLERGRRTTVWSYDLQDYGGVPADWAQFLQEVVDELRRGRRIIAFCVGSHGRTGTFLSSLVSLVEDRAVTPDPIEAVRARHCYKAVESRAQAEAVFALRGEALPPQYATEFAPRPAYVAAGRSEVHTLAGSFGSWRGDE